MKLTMVLEPDEDGGYTAHCPELDVASQGDTEDEAADNLSEAIDLLLETAPREEIVRRYRPGVVVRSKEVAYA
ncbi:MAG: type II toxin-antitoxin system HicB family antitoxin [Akkermansiaceae bacterium]|nr:type II toxin-antitoxin system HicB family antitoxin [Akkermansiaceae bacterium]MCP5551220.1 type II toxin-antitoxin system HicB family antitoxin [Akkermansiaceae bacterium]